MAKATQVALVALAEAKNLQEFEISATIEVIPSSTGVPTFGDYRNAVQALLMEDRANPFLSQMLGDLVSDDLKPQVERVTSPNGGEPASRFAGDSERLLFPDDDYGWLSFLAWYVAVALARLTNGFICSDDGGINYDLSPVDPETFLATYPQWITDQSVGNAS